MQITITVSDKIVQSYLDHYNEEFDTDHTVENLTEAQKKVVENAFRAIAEGEIEMRTDDHDEFETENYFSGL